MNNALKYGLENLEMVDKNGLPTGLVAVNKPDKIDFSKHSAEEIIAIENAFAYQAHYIYFRRFKNRPSVPQVYIYDYTTKDVNNDDLILLHQRLYSSGRVPIFFVFTNKDVRIFNCYDRPAKGNNLVYKPLEIISLAARVSNLFGEQDQSDIDKFKAFSGRSFDNGSFWESSPYSINFQFSNSAYEKLLTELKQALNDIITKRILPANIARKIMVVSILIKYLEERTDEHQNSVFPKAGEVRKTILDGKRRNVKFDKNFFDRFAKGATCFTDVLKVKGAGLKLLKYLALHFNGGVFKLSDIEKESLEKTDLNRFALFLEGQLEGVQYVFWRLYSFNDLPVELISNIYEEFLEKKPGVVYTPPYLVNFLLDESMPLKNEEIDFKVLDPACGSGVFLVGAYRRLIYRWRKQNGWKTPKLSLLKKLLKNNIYGSDKDPEAVNLTIFSLSLALCDELSPLEIWETLEFDDLTEGNIFADDFFNLLQEQIFIPKSFNLVIGNPPFIQSDLTEAASLIEKIEYNKRIILQNGNKVKVKLPRGQIALLFLEQSIPLCKDNGLVCLIQSSAPFLYNNSSVLFRQYLMEKYDVPQIIDFSHIARILFGANGDVPTAAIFIKNARSNKKPVLHITVRRTKPHKEKLYFELDTYDFNYITWKLAAYDPYIWKANYLGGKRHYLLIKKLIGFPRLEDLLIENEWDYGAGFRVGNKDNIEQLKLLQAKITRTSKEDIELDELKKKYKKAKEVQNLPFLPTEGLTSEGINAGAITKNPFGYFENIKNEKVYLGPHLLIKEGIGNDQLIMDITQDGLSFQEKIIGIHCDKKDYRKLKQLHQYLKEPLVSYFLAATSAEYQLRRATSLKKYDIDNIPVVPDKETNLNETDEILISDYFKYLIDFRSKGEKSIIATKDIQKNDWEQFGNAFCSVLKSVYPSVKSHTPLETESYLCYPFYFGDNPDIHYENASKADEEIEKLVKKICGVSLRITRIIRFYDRNVIFLIKPKKLRYWLRSIALRDADETFSDLRKQGF